MVLLSVYLCFLLEWYLFYMYKYIIKRNDFFIWIMLVKLLIIYIVMYLNFEYSILILLK